jgi:hypothetical protein
MRPQLVRIVTRVAERLADQDLAVANARGAATALARSRVERLEVENFLEQKRRDAWSGRPGRSAAARAAHGH